MASSAHWDLAVDATPEDSATVAFIDLAGFSAITDVYGDAVAVAMVGLFEAMVRSAVESHAPPVKWIGDEVMLSFPNPKTALGALGTLIMSCRAEARLPLTRTAIHHGPVIRRGNDLFGATVNIAARVAAMAAPGQLLATRPLAEVAEAEGIVARGLGATQIRSLQTPLDLYEIQVAPAPDPAWIDPVCKMHAPFSLYERAEPTAPWFCSPECETAFARFPDVYAVHSIPKRQQTRLT